MMGFKRSPLQQFSKVILAHFFGCHKMRARWCHVKQASSGNWANRTKKTIEYPCVPKLTQRVPLSILSPGDPKICGAFPHKRDD